MSESGRSNRISRGTLTAGTLEISAYTASNAVAFPRATTKNRVSALRAPQTSKRRRSFPARTSPAEGGRLRCGSAAARRRRCRDRDQELKREPLPCLINSAGSSTYPAPEICPNDPSHPSARRFFVRRRKVERGRLERAIGAVALRVQRGSGRAARDGRLLRVFQGSRASRASAVLAFGNSSSRWSRYARGSIPLTRAQLTSE
jgi:hypothetical protein